jgi:hypothetical protein
MPKSRKKCQHCVRSAHSLADGATGAGQRLRNVKEIGATVGHFGHFGCLLVDTVWSKQTVATHCG